MNTRSLLTGLCLVLFAVIAAFALLQAPAATVNVLGVVAVCGAVVGYVALSPRRRGLVSAINVAEGTHYGSVSKKTDAALATRNLLVKHGSDGNHMAACGANDIPLGVCDDEADAAELDRNCELLGISKRTMLMVASEAITVGEAVFTAAGGKIQDLPAGAGTYYQVGYAMTAAGADGDVIEVQHMTPIKTVVT